MRELITSLGKAILEKAQEGVNQALTLLYFGNRLEIFDSGNAILLTHVLNAMESDKRAMKFIEIKNPEEMHYLRSMIAQRRGILKIIQEEDLKEWLENLLTSEDNNGEIKSEGEKQA